VREGGTLRWAALDGQGNVAGLVGAGDGVVAGWYEYGPYGELLRATGAAGLSNPLRYEGKLEDRETGLVYYGFRYYHPGLGRWIGKDPMGEVGGLNLYGYVGGDPINWMDPYGLWTWRGVMEGTADWLVAQRNETKELANGQAGGLGSQLGVTAFNTALDVSTPMIDIFQGFAHLGKKEGKLVGDPSWENARGVLADALLVGSLVPGVGAAVAKARQAASKSVVCEVGEKAVEQIASTEAKAAAAGVSEAARTATPSGQFYSVAFETRLNPSS